MNLGALPQLPTSKAELLSWFDMMSDPQRARTFMQDIEEKHRNASAAIEHATKLQQQLAVEQSVASDTRAAWEKDRAAHSAFLADAGRQLDSRTADLEVREKRLAEATSAHAAHVAEHQETVAALEMSLAEYVRKTDNLAKAQAIYDRNVERLRRAWALIDEALKLLEQPL